MLDTRELGRRPGSQREVTLSVPAPADLGIEVLRVPEGAPVELDLRLEAVMEGVLVTGSGASRTSSGECARCLEPISDEIEVTFQELFVYDDAPGAPPRRTTRSAGSRTTCSTSSRCCGTRWCSHCRSSRCAEDDCPGLCTECGARLADDPDHAHEAAIDPRWASLATLQQDPTSKTTEQDSTEEKTVAVPKRKMSRSNTRHRRSQWKAVAPSLVTCANPACGAKHLPHRACGECGQYGARADRRQVL